jgi:hypothetical protein
VPSQKENAFKYFLHKKGKYAVALYKSQEDLNPMFQSKDVRSDMYLILLGCLLNALVEELIIRVTTVEDVPATTAVHLVTVFSVVINRAPRLFQVTSYYMWRLDNKSKLQYCTVGYSKIGVLNLWPTARFM